MKDIARTQVRIPVDLMDWLKQQAKEHHRSMNAQLIELLAQMKRQTAQ
ncbi:Arc family DNA-binding protein [Pseudomonas cavernicola]|uniref:Arc family DNA-binding protein n=1 Tax=Pseudomonas cavernicola TaxID=2320866 RepID=A0A418XEF2_9PSED|nr:Arc family DNA-binding protein [Pseudomonas cavernicola]RJG10911.1 Arc family DNA-binding protein [Pseudomonas cavernicola]